METTRRCGLRAAASFSLPSLKSCKFLLNPDLDAVVSQVYHCPIDGSEEILVAWT